MKRPARGRPSPRPSWVAAARIAALVGAAAIVAAAAAGAQAVSFKDPAGDDHGPGTYTYPTDPAYRPGSFDLTGFSLKARGNRVDLDVAVAASLDDPWNTGAGFSVQMVFIFIQTRPGGGFTAGIPGLNVQFAPADAWDRCIILSPAEPSVVRAEVEAKAPKMSAAIVVPARVKGSGHTISASIDRHALGEGDPTGWGYQVVMQSFESFPTAAALLTRKVGEHGGQHQLGGAGGDCAPNVIDLLGGNGRGDASEVELQHQMLQYECNPDGTPKKLATLKMVHFKK